MPGKKSAAVKPQFEAVGSSPSGSPRSLSSDDAMAMAALAQQVKESRNKKKMEMETEFINNAKADLNKTVASKKRILVQAVAKIDVVHEQFLDALAAREDAIRAIAVQLAHEQKQLEDAIAKIRTLRTEREDVRVEKHAEALGATAGACKDFVSTLRTLSDGAAEEDQA